MAGAVDLVSFTESVGNTILAHATCSNATPPQLMLTPDQPRSLSFSARRYHSFQTTLTATVKCI